MTRALKAALGIVLCAGCFSEWKGPGQPPVASVQCKPQVALGASMTLDGTQSFDPEEEYLGFQWTVLVAPDGSQAKPLEQTPTTAEISPDTEGEYVVELTVTDASGLSARALARFEASGVSSPGTGDPWFEPPSGGSWSRRRQIRIDNSKLGEELTNFPLLVLLHAARVDLGFVQAGGGDLRFVGRQNAAPLSHEIEQWSVDGKSYVWVRLPRIPPAGQEASFYMYYGNPTAVAAEVPADVWKDRFVAVYHLATGKDSTGHGFDGTIHGSTAVPAVLGLGQSFVKSSAQYIDLGKNRPIFQSVSGCTLSAWIKPKSFTVDWDTVVGFSVHDAATVPTYSRASLAIKIDKSATIIGDTHDDGSWKELTSPALTVNDWVHVTGVNNFQADAQLIYLDGVERNSKQGVGFGAPATPATAPSGGAIGAQENLASCFFDGLIDEVRLSHEVFSPAWIALDFKSMADTLLTFGEEELKP